MLSWVEYSSNNLRLRSVFIGFILLFFCNLTLASIKDVKTIIIEPSNNKSNRGHWLQVSEVVALETGSQKDLALIANKAITKSSSHYSNQSHGNNAISGVGPDKYPNIFHSGGRDKAPNLKVILSQSSDLDSITIFGRADGNSGRDIYDLTLLDERGKTIIKRVNLNATSSSHAVKVDFTVGKKGKEVAVNPEKMSTTANSNTRRQSRSSAQNIATLYKEGLTAINRGELEKAQSIFTSVLKQNPKANFARGARNQLAKINQKNYFKATNAYTNKKYDAAETLFKQIIATSKNSSLVGGAKTHLELIAQGRKEQVSNDIGAQLLLQGVETVDITKISGEALFLQALKNWSHHQDEVAISLLDAYIDQGDTANRLEDAQLLLKAIVNPKSFLLANQTSQSQKVMKQVSSILHKNISTSNADFDVLRRVDNNFRSAIERNNEKYLPNEKSYRPFTDYVHEDIVSAFYTRTDKNRAFYYHRKLSSPPAKQGLIYNQLIQPLSTGFKKKVRKVYDSLIFTITKKKRSDDVSGKKIQVAVNVEARGSSLPFEDNKQLNAIAKHHIKSYLLSQSFNDVFEVDADYTFYSDYKPYAGITATYEKSNWAFGKADISSVAALTRPPTKEELQKIADAKLKPGPLGKVSGEKRTQKQILASIKPIQEKIDNLLKAWPQHQNKKLSNLDRRQHQTYMVEYARDEIPNLMSSILNSALLLLQSIDSDDTKAYSRWDRELSKPIRKVLDGGLTLWDYGFNNGTKNQVNSTFGSSSYTDPFVHAKIPNLINNLMAYQYDWVKKNRVGTIADPNLELPIGISGGNAKVSYKKPVRIRARLNTPTEMFFEGLGQQAGEGVAAFLSYKGQLVEFERKINENRKAYFECYPKCKDFNSISAKFSRLLIEKDVHYLKLSGNYNPLSDRLDRGLSALVEITGIKQGSSLIDGGIPNRCRGEFETWSYYYSLAVDAPIDKQMNDTFSALGKLAKGNVTALQKLGHDNKQTQQLAFNKTADYYSRYQLCRDQWEFDKWEDKHGELDEESSWFGF